MDIILGPWIRSHAPELTPENKTDKTADRVEEAWPRLEKEKKKKRKREKETISAACRTHAYHVS